MSNFENHENYNCKLVTDTGEEFFVYANWLHNQKLDHWKGWHCEAGSTRILIEKDFSLYSGECKNDYLGSAVGEFKILTGTVCQQEICGPCTDDLIIPKHQ